MKYKVIGWINYDDETYPEMPDGSWDELCEVTKAVVENIKENKYRFGGIYHQVGAAGVPVLNNGMKYICSARFWGDIMAYVWGGNYANYAFDLDGYCDTPVKYPQAFVDESQIVSEDTVFEVGKYEEFEKVFLEGVKHPELKIAKFLADNNLTIKGLPFLSNSAQDDDED